MNVNILPQVHMNVNIPPHPFTPSYVVPEAWTSLYIHVLYLIFALVFSGVAISTQVVLVYNGEIYNFKALRPESTSDGEALVPLYLQRGDLFTRLSVVQRCWRVPWPPMDFFGVERLTGESCWFMCNGQFESKILNPHVWGFWWAN